MNTFNQKHQKKTNMEMNETNERLILAIERLNQNLERFFPKMSTMTRSQVMKELGISTATVSNYETKFGKNFKICRNEYSAEFVRQLKERKKYA